MKFEAVIGLEVHAQLLTESKIFCACPNRFGAGANSQVCPICAGMPGTLPVLNKKVVELALRMAIATHCDVKQRSVFARKNYFYPDLPKGYQVSQYERPLCEKGYLDILPADGKPRRIQLTRIHLEEDAGKSIHDRSDDETYVDFNRCGTPLIEIVTDPVIHTAEEAFLYLTQLKQILQYLEVCDGNMEEGSLRCDANVSIRPVGQTTLGTKTELKNMNSFHNVEKAIKHEIDRQIQLVESGGRVIQQTLLWDADKGIARPMRDKEEANDYRYFPEPDLMDVIVEPEWVAEIRKSLPALPEERIQRYQSEWGLPEYDATVLTEERKVADFFERAAKSTAHIKTLSNWMMGEVLRLSKESGGLSQIRIVPEALSELVNLIEKGTITGKIAKTVFEHMAQSGDSPISIIEKQNLSVVTDEGELLSIIRAILEKNPSQVDQYKAGKTKILGFFVGEIMKATRGKANPAVVNPLLEKTLASS
ncbi:MAG: aspartyl/glutamyl-tRNA amidotransferase subunit B [Elusimicrobia bacterium RIFOXYB2_FULL_49_7]|nr:MAG: aspartyl/glutamyl-tRNA amidotransferase subunit B [Elusimicrobia bacterium RIFOXYB2_FULL_49_7]